MSMFSKSLYQVEVCGLFTARRPVVLPQGYNPPSRHSCGSGSHHTPNSQYLSEHVGFLQTIFNIRILRENVCPHFQDVHGDCLTETVKLCLIWFS